MDEQFSDALEQVLRDRCAPDVVRQIEAGASAAPLWEALEDSGFGDAMLAEEAGGAGLALGGAFSLMALCGTYALPVPLAETMLARALLARAGVERPPGSITLALAEAQGGDVLCRQVTSGRVAHWVLAELGDELLLLPVAQAAASAGVFPLDAQLRWAALVAATAQRMRGAHDLRTLQACLYAAQLAGALRRVFEQTLQYANDRIQFGRPIGKLQAIQHMLSVAAEETAAAHMAARIGCMADGLVPDRLRAATAKARTSEAALQVASISHAVHGAIGFTAEFDLQLFTRRLHLWRQAGGAESYWHRVAGQELVDHEGAALALIRRTTDMH